MVEPEEVRPLPVPKDHGSDIEETAFYSHKMQRVKFIKCCGCVAAFFLILAIVFIILMFTIFRIKDPKIKLNSFTITRLELINGTEIPIPGFNMSLIADVSVKNPNMASFRYSNTTTSLYYHGSTVGEARGPPGRAKARRTMRMNITVDVITDRLISNPNLQADMRTGFLTMESYSRIGGRVNIWNIFKKHVTVRMNCSMMINISSRAISEQKCKKKVNL